MKPPGLILMWMGSLLVFVIYGFLILLYGIKLGSEACTGRLLGIEFVNSFYLVMKYRTGSFGFMLIMNAHLPKMDILGLSCVKWG